MYICGAYFVILALLVVQYLCNVNRTMWPRLGYALLLHTFAGQGIVDPANFVPPRSTNVVNNRRMLDFHCLDFCLSRRFNCGPDEAVRSLGELKHTARPVMITFQEMLKLMGQCQQIEEQNSHHEETLKNTTTRRLEGRGILGNNPITLLSGIIPGTKWCGTGDIALEYHDLGAEANVDKCCRAHDLCPVKVRAYSSRYNLTNQSLYTKSHCKCDDSLYECLKRQHSQTAAIMGNIYFNLVQVPCVEDTKNGKKFRHARSNF